MTDSSQTKIAFFGECMIELSGDPIRKGFGGDTLNTALYLSRLTAEHSVQVSYATGLGEDVLSQELLENWPRDLPEGEDHGDVLPGKMMNKLIRLGLV